MVLAAMAEPESRASAASEARILVIFSILLSIYNNKAISIHCFDAPDIGVSKDSQKMFKIDQSVHDNWTAKAGHGSTRGRTSPKCTLYGARHREWLPGAPNPQRAEKDELARKVVPLA